MLENKSKGIFWTQWLTTKEAAWHLRITANALRVLVHRKKVKAHKFGHRLRFKRSYIDSLIKE